MAGIETMRAAIAAFNRRDAEAFSALLTDDADIVPVRAAVEGTVYSGPTAGADYCKAVEQTWEDLRWEVEDIREGRDWVLAVGRISGRGRETGAAIDVAGGWVARLRDGRISHFHTYTDRTEALKAVGLGE